MSYVTMQPLQQMLGAQSNGDYLSSLEQRIAKLESQIKAHADLLTQATSEDNNFDYISELNKVFREYVEETSKRIAKLESEVPTIIASVVSQVQFKANINNMWKHYHLLEDQNRKLSQRLANSEELLRVLNDQINYMNSRINTAVPLVADVPSSAQQNPAVDKSQKYKHGECDTFNTRLCDLERSDVIAHQRIFRLEDQVKSLQQPPVIDESQKCICDPLADIKSPFCPVHLGKDLFKKNPKTYWVNVYRSANGKIITAIETYESEEDSDRAAWKDNPTAKFIKTASFTIDEAE